MLTGLKIRNFIGIKELDLQLRTPLVLFAGPNGAGKSSIGEAFRFTFLDDNPRIDYKKDRPHLVHVGAKNGFIEIAWDTAVVKKSIKDGALTGDIQAIPQDLEAAQFCLGVNKLSRISDKVRRTLMLRLAGVDLSVENIANHLFEKGIDLDTIKRYRPLLLKGGFEIAHERAKKAVSEARGGWKAVTGEAYGSVKAEDWEPADVVVSAKDVATNIAEIDADIAEIETKRDDELAPLLASISSIETEIARPEPLACPGCGIAIFMDPVSGALKCYEGARDKSQLVTQLNLKKVKANDIRKRFGEALTGLEDDKRVLREQVQAAEQAAHKKKRAAELHQEAVTAERLATLLSDGPDGIAAELIADKLEKVNERFREIGEGIGWLPVVLQPDMSIRRADGHTYRLLSRSEKWRADAMLHILVSELAAFPWLILDDMDTLEPAARTPFVRWLDGYVSTREDEPTILVFAALKAKPSAEAFGSLETYWVEKGKIKVAPV